MKYLMILFALFSGIGYAEEMDDPSLFHQLVFTIRDPLTDAKTLHQSLVQLGKYLAREIKQDLGPPADETALSADVQVLVTISQASGPLLQGVQEIFPQAKVAFLDMARQEAGEDVKDIALLELKRKTVILIDTTLASKGAMIDAVALLQERKPAKIIVVCAIAAQEGIELLVKRDPKIAIYPAAIDPTLEGHAYIVSGFGDAGDRSFDQKR